VIDLQYVVQSKAQCIISASVHLADSDIVAIIGRGLVEQPEADGEATVVWGMMH
jgi:hypothetical protein